MILYIFVFPYLIKKSNLYILYGENQNTKLLFIDVLSANNPQDSNKLISYMTCLKLCRVNHTDLIVRMKKVRLG